MSLRIKVRYDDRLILEVIQRKLKCGSITRATKDAHNPRVNFIVTGNALSDIIIPTLDLHNLRAKKAVDFSIWKEGITLIHQVKARPRVYRPGWGRGYMPKWSISERNRLATICQKLRESKRYKGGGG